MNIKLWTTVFVSVFLLSTVTVLPAAGTDIKNQPVSTNEDEIIEMINQIDESLLFYCHYNLMRFGPRYTGTINCTLAGQYIYDEFEEMGLDVEFHEWRYDGFNSRNVIGTLHGNDPTSTAIFLMTAHYDTVPDAPGANDDGSGVAAVLATAKIMSQYSFNHTIRFITFSGEEVGAYGSFSYARDAYNRGDNIVAVINPDMVGYADTAKGGRILRFFPPERSEWIAEFATTISEKYMELIDLSVEIRPNYIGADHQPFIDYGFDGIWIAHHDGYPWGHSPEDTLDHINFTYEVKATKFLLAVMAKLSIKPIDVQIILKTPYEGYGYFFNRPIIPLHLGRQWYKGLRGMTFILGRAVASADVIANEEIEYVIFCIDANFMYWDSEPPYEWKIQGKHFPPIGRHKLKVYAYTTSGKGATDEMDIIIFTFSSQYGKW